MCVEEIRMYVCVFVCVFVCLCLYVALGGMHVSFYACIYLHVSVLYACRFETAVSIDEFIDVCMLINLLIRFY